MSDKKSESSEVDKGADEYGSLHEAIFELVELIMDKKSAPFLFIIISVIINFILVVVFNITSQSLGGNAILLEGSFYTANLAYGVGFALMLFFLVLAFVYPDKKITTKTGFMSYLLCMIFGYGYANLALGFLMVEIMLVYIIVMSIYTATDGTRQWFSTLEEKIVK